MDRQTYTGNYRHYPHVPPLHAATTQRWDAEPSERADEGKVPLGFQPARPARPLTFRDYQKQALSTAQYPYAGSGERGVLYPALGLAGEAGEVAEKVKKLWRNKDLELDPGDVDSLTKELGDVLWYVSAMASELGIDLGDVAAANLAKLADRAARGVIKSEGDDR